jgi:flagellin-like protein
MSSRPRSSPTARRRRRRRGVSDTIAVVLLVAFVVVLAVILYILVGGLTRAPGPTPIGTGFVAGDPSSATLCTAPDAPTVGCVAGGDYVYAIPIEQSTVPMDAVLFEVKSPDGSAYAVAGQGGFNILNTQGHTVASYNLSGPGPLAVADAGAWTYYTGTTGISATDPLSTLYTIVIDMGSADPSGGGYVFVALGTGAYSGATNALSLP